MRIPKVYGSPASRKRTSFSSNSLSLIFCARFRPIPPYSSFLSPSAAVVSPLRREGDRICAPDGVIILRVSNDDGAHARDHSQRRRGRTLCPAESHYEKRPNGDRELRVCKVVDS